MVAPIEVAYPKEFEPMTVAASNAAPPRSKEPFVIGPDGLPLTLADLPPPNTKRWVIRRKAEVVSAVRGGLLTLEEACARYTLTMEEFLGWQKAIDQFGMPGLRATRVQQYR
jgi:hypothetical protein